MKYLLDTNICIYLIKKKPPQVLQKFTRHSAGEIGVSTITVAELRLGVQKSRQRLQNEQALDRFLIPLAIAEFDYEAAVAYGRLRAALEAAGTPIGPLDMLIAAHAVSLGVTLVTNNIHEFARVPGLKVENWAGE